MKNENHYKTLIRITTAIINQFIISYGLNKDEAFRISGEATKKEFEKMTAELKEN